MYWSKKEGDRTIQFDGIPFTVEKVTFYDCQYGEHYWKDKPKQYKRLRLQTTRKFGRHAHIVTRSYKLYPEYKMIVDGMSKHQVRKSKEYLIATARVAIKAGLAKSSTKYFVSLPTLDAHSSTDHPKGFKATFSQRVNPIIISKISELVSSGITETKEVQRALNNYVKHNLQSEHGIIVHSNDRAFHPLPVDIKNHVDSAKQALQLSKLDQENLRLKIEGWKKQSPESLHYFRPYIQCDHDQPTTSQALSCSDTEIGSGYSQTILWVHQESWQKDLLLKYENIITLIDATYKTTKYDLPLFFLCVPTNVNYTTVAEFVVQSEAAECISEALSIIKQWNPKWSPPFFMTDYSDAEQLAVNTVFPDCTVYLCDFHREQCWERWVKDHNHNLTKDDANKLLSFCMLKQ